MTNLRTAVYEQGFLGVQGTPDYRYHDDLGTLDFVIRVEPGPLFHMGTFTIEGLPEPARARLAKVSAIPARGLPPTSTDLCRRVRRTSSTQCLVNTSLT